MRVNNVQAQSLEVMHSFVACLRSHVRIPQNHGQPRMAQQVSDHPQAHALLYQQRRKRVPRIMRL